MIACLVCLCDWQPFPGVLSFPFYDSCDTLQAHHDSEKDEVVLENESMDEFPRL